jgi:hypothetical protein
VNYIAAYGRLLLGRTNANFLGLPNSKTFQAVVLLTAAVNRAVEIPRQFVPGATRVSEAVGQRVRQHMIRRFAAGTNGDASLMKWCQRAAVWRCPTPGRMTSSAVGRAVATYSACRIGTTASVSPCQIRTGTFISVYSSPDGVAQIR